MSGTKVKNKYEFIADSFWLSYSLWIIGIFLNAIPIVFNVVNEWFLLEESKMKQFDFFRSIISSCDFMYVFCSVGFILIIEIFLIKNKTEWNKLHNLIFGITLIYSITLLVLFTISSFSPNWSSHISEGQIANINFISFIIMFISSTLYFVFAHIKVSRCLVKEGKES